MVGVKSRRTPNSLNWIVTVLPAAPALHDGIGILAAGQEARFLAVLRDQVRLGQALEETLGLQRLDHADRLFFESRRNRFRKSLNTVFRPVPLRRGELLRRRAAEPAAILEPEAKQVAPSSVIGGAAHFGEADTQHDLVAATPSACLSRFTTSSFFST